MAGFTVRAGQSLLDSVLEVGAIHGPIDIRNLGHLAAIVSSDLGFDRSFERVNFT